MFDKTGMRYNRVDLCSKMIIWDKKVLSLYLSVGYNRVRYIFGGRLMEAKDCTGNNIVFTLVEMV